MFEYQEGDKLMCKKFFKDKDNLIQFYEGSIYNTYRVETLYNVETSDEQTFSASRYIEVKNGRLTYRFNEEEFYTHFYSKKEIRKLKLDQIETINPNLHF